MPGQELSRAEKAKIAKREYMREYRRKHRERQKEWDEEYWAKRYERDHKEGDQNDR